VKKGQIKIHLRQRRKKKWQKIQVASPHQFILFFLFYFFRVSRSSGQAILSVFMASTRLKLKSFPQLLKPL